MYNYTMEDFNKVQKEIKRRFKEAGDKYLELKSEMDKVTQELTRIQGEYRLIQNLKKKKTDTLKAKQK